MTSKRASLWKTPTCLALVLLAGGGLGLLSGCPTPPPTPDPGVTDATITGVVTNALSDQPIQNVTITLTPDAANADITTDANGRYEVEVPVGVYEVMFEAEGFETLTRLVAALDTTTLNVELTPTQNVVLTTTVNGEANPGGSFSVTVNPLILDGNTQVQSYAWTQDNEVPLALTSATSQTVNVAVPALPQYKDHLFNLLAEPPISEEELPPNVPLPEEFPGGLQDRWQVVGLTPFVLEETAHVTLTVTVTTTSGTFTEEVEVLVNLPWTSTSGLRNVPINVPVLLHGKDQASYNWTLTAPAGSTASLADAATQNPSFTPDVPGVYTVTVADLAAGQNVVLTIVAGTWQGAITGVDAQGLPLAQNCTLCHRPGGVGLADGNQFAEWRETGHAMIFTDQINFGDHYSESCIVCHTVGWNPNADNAGIDDAPDYDAFIASDLFERTGPGIYQEMLSRFPNAARYTNIQCENCHGPNITELHFNGDLDDARISISSDVCATCHGEPLRHGRFQQWQLSAHANYELAIDEGTNGNCARCHTGNGFLNWLPVLLDEDPNTNPLSNITVNWEQDDTHPQTCVVCHDPHNVGTVSGDQTDVTVRIFGDTPPLIAGFQAFGVGNGAICMTCHNTRRGLRNDETFASIKAQDDQSRAPHPSAQTDVLMGQNAFFVDVGLRGGHSLVTHTCVNCHMQATPPPDLLSYNEGGANHTFFASPDICSDCHGASFTADGVQDAYAASEAELHSLLVQAILSEMQDLIDAGNTLDLGGARTITNTNQISSIDFTETHGQQAFTFHMADGTTIELVAVEDILVMQGGVEQGHFYEFADDRIAKAGWNFILAHADGSKGVHYPSFVFEFMDAASDALRALLAE